MRQSDPSPLAAKPWPRWWSACALMLALAAPAGLALAQESPEPARGEEASAPSEAADAESGDAAQAGHEAPPVWNRRVAPATGVDAQLRRLTADLGLDPGQQDRIRPVLVAQREQVKHLQAEPGLSPAERKRRILALGDRTADQIRAQLTDRQRAQYIKPRATAVATPAAPKPGTPPARNVKP